MKGLPVKNKRESFVFTVPCYSQFLDIKNKSWRSTACGVVALKMVLDYFLRKNKRRAPAADRLMAAGITSGAYGGADMGWRHRGLAQMAAPLGLAGKNFDWWPKSPAEAYRLLVARLKTGPVIASIYKNFKPGSSGHLVVITGINNDIIFYNDPIAKNRQTIKRKISVEKFLAGWKRRIIVVSRKK